MDKKNPAKPEYDMTVWITRKEWVQSNRKREQIKLINAKKVHLWLSNELPAQHNAISLSLTLIKGSNNMHTLCPSTLSKTARKGHLLFSKASQSTSLLLLFLSKYIPTLLSQKSCSAVQPMRASLRPQYRFHLTAALSVLCVYDYCDTLLSSIMEESAQDWVRSVWFSS